MKKIIAFLYIALAVSASGQPDTPNRLRAFPITDYFGQIPQLAAHFIRLRDIYENNFYDRYTVFQNWTKDYEMALLDSLSADIRFTGTYYLENDRSMNQLIQRGSFKGKHLLYVMQECKVTDVRDFIGYRLARTRL